MTPTTDDEPLRAGLEALIEFRQRVHDSLGEAIHTGLRKGVDGLGSDRAWAAISSMDGDGWSQAVEFAISGLEMGLEKKLAAAVAALASPPPSQLAARPGGERVLIRKAGKLLTYDGQFDRGYRFIRLGDDERPEWLRGASAQDLYEIDDPAAQASPEHGEGE